MVPVEPTAASPAVGPPPGLGRAAMLAVAFAGFATFLDLYATQPLLPRLAEEFHASKAEVGLTVSAPTAAVAMLAPVFGMFGDRVPRERVMVASLAVLSLTTFAAAGVRDLASLVAWRFCEGAATAGVYVNALAYLSDEAGPALLGRAMAAFVSGNVIGGFVGRAIAGAAADRGPWSRAFWALGALNALGALVTWRCLPAARNFAPRARGARRAGGVAALATPRLAATFVIGFGVLFSLVASFSYAVFYLAGAPFFLTSGQIGAVFSVYLFGAFVTPFVGRLIDRSGARLVLACALGAGALGILLTLAPSLVAIGAGLALVCAAAFVCQSASTTQLRAASPPGLRSLASGGYVTCYYLGGSAGGLAPALVWRSTGWPGCVALVVVVDALVAALALRFWRDAPVRDARALAPTTR